MNPLAFRLWYTWVKKNWPELSDKQIDNLTEKLIGGEHHDKSQGRR